MDLLSDESDRDQATLDRRSTSGPRATDLSGRDWTRFSISVWNDIRQTPDERRLSHQAMFPTMLVDRLIQCFTSSGNSVVLDPFTGSGSTLVAAQNRGKSAIGFEVYGPFIDLTHERLRQ